MNIQEAASLLGWSRDKTRAAIEDGVHVESVGLTKLSARAHGTGYDVTDEELNRFLAVFEANEPGRHPPVRVRRKLLIEASFKCAVCRSDAPLQFHHIIEWSDLKHHDPSHMLAICGICHDKIRRTGQIDFEAQRLVKSQLSDALEEDFTESGVTEFVEELRESARSIIDAKEEQRVVWILPRGFVILGDLVYQEHSSWAVVADYYDFHDGWRTGTHYHASYRGSWRDPYQLGIQCRKMGVPIGDWRFARGALGLLQEFRHAEQPMDIEQVVERLRNEGAPVLYFPPSTEVVLEEIPRYRYDELAPGPYQDVIEELKEFASGTGPEWMNWHQEVRSLRHRAFKTARKHLSDNDPSIDFIEEIRDRYREDMSRDELLAWVKEFRTTLVEALSSA